MPDFMTTDYPRWFIFGESADRQLVDIADPDNATVIAHVPRTIAETIIQAHNRVIDHLEHLKPSETRHNAAKTLFIVPDPDGLGFHSMELFTPQKECS